ncbi:hypothetical protein GLAREA_09353 [Glarea lozoyensis ATCC 20868]|uniref:Uncharacterized protein n=1 Tax=Glarea lozoyensis (strain ATCC 20868 / MF5171) TaxID=1116229 RepID=S3DP48_GLAL2|nr:uncharacterized protein GLAREA_09353 [Glarea lozoyensis ATCC 20868]EPE28233.1 hypothetical protein GLAREA_09353 [Glarea lozoyensis ATCC 20868]
MPKCRQCLNTRLTGRPQESQQLVKYRPGAAPRMIITSAGFVGTYNQKFVHQHLPNVFHEARNRGDRVVHGMEWFQQQLQFVGSPVYIGGAIDWVLSRVQLYQNLCPFQGTTFGDPRPVNLFGRYLEIIQNPGTNNARLNRALNDVVELFNAVAIVLRTDIGFAFSERLLLDYCEAAQRLIPWTSFFDPNSIFDIIRAAYELSERDLNVIDQLRKGLGPWEISTARTDAAAAYQWKGDFLARDIALYI